MTKPHADADGDNISSFPSVGWLQIQSGSHLGRTIRLDKAFTRIGRPDGELAVIARRDDGYFLSHLQGDKRPLLNNEEIGDQTNELRNNDRICIGELTVQFFSDTNGAQSSDVEAIEQDDTHQRDFSRISFDVAASISDRQQSWETRLIDISMHGALIQLPENFTPEQDQPLGLIVHLEGGPDISMVVEIAHQETHELGLNCHDIDVDSITHLRRLVELNLGDPELLERELSALG